MNYLDLPDFNNSFYDSSLRYELHPDLIFVFGSNERGAHGKGAALQAVTQYGAKYGKGYGLHGQSFAIPTKDFYIRTLPLEKIKLYVDDFKNHLKNTTEFYFFVTPIGTGLAKHAHSSIAPMFKGVHNCWLPEEWREYLS